MVETKKIVVGTVIGGLSLISLLKLDHYLKTQHPARMGIRSRMRFLMETGRTPKEGMDYQASKFPHEVIGQVGSSFLEREQKRRMGASYETKKEKRKAMAKKIGKAALAEARKQTGFGHYNMLLNDLYEERSGYGYGRFNVLGAIQ